MKTIEINVENYLELVRALREKKAESDKRNAENLEKPWMVSIINFKNHCDEGKDYFFKTLKSAKAEAVKLGSNLTNEQFVEIKKWDPIEETWDQYLTGKNYSKALKFWADEDFH